MALGLWDLGLCCGDGFLFAWEFLWGQYKEAPHGASAGVTNEIFSSVQTASSCKGFGFFKRSFETL